MNGVAKGSSRVYTGQSGSKLVCRFAYSAQGCEAVLNNRATCTIKWKMAANYEVSSPLGMQSKLCTYLSGLPSPAAVQVRRLTQTKVTCPILFWIYWGHCWKDNSIFCDGDCKELAHRHCAGLSKACFLSASTLSWAFCPQCLLANQSKEILCLKESVESLAAEVSRLKT